jgi:hypothetical protein
MSRRLFARAQWRGRRSSSSRRVASLGLAERRDSTVDAGSLLGGCEREWGGWRGTFAFAAGFVDGVFGVCFRLHGVLGQDRVGRGLIGAVFTLRYCSGSGKFG